VKHDGVGEIQDAGVGQAGANAGPGVVFEAEPRPDAAGGLPCGIVRFAVS
jgi:hypothetical protein